MIDWERFTLFLYILTRMSGFVLFSPIFGRKGIANIVRAGMILVLSLSVLSFTPGGASTAQNLIEFAVKLVMEFALGYLLALVMQIFFSIVQVAGEAVDTQMGLSMAKTYDAGAQASMSVTGTILNLLMHVLFFAANGHYTLLRIMLTSGDIVAYGTARLSDALSNAVVEIFVSCMIMALKLAMPILAAELMGQVGMGILMKAIPQINVFSINMELKIIIGLVMVMLLMVPFAEYLLAAENEMLAAVQYVLALAGG